MSVSSPHSRKPGLLALFVCVREIDGHGNQSGDWEEACRVALAVVKQGQVYSSLASPDSQRTKM